MGRIWACGCLDGLFMGMMRSHSMFHYERFKRKRGLEKEGALFHVRPK